MITKTRCLLSEQLPLFGVAHKILIDIGLVSPYYRCAFKVCVWSEMVARDVFVSPLIQW
jgi:hypothetical protein